MGKDLNRIYGRKGKGRVGSRRGWDSMGKGGIA